MSTHRGFWNKEYKSSGHLKLSAEASEDLIIATKWIERRTGHEYLNPLATVLDLGTGNGRHLIYMAKTYGTHGIGYDISEEAIKMARDASLQLPIKYEARSIEGDFDKIKDGSITIVLDLMTSHFLKAQAREHLRDEVLRVLKPRSTSSGQGGGWYILKSFLADEDLHTKRLLRDHPADEEGAYIHPEFGMYEYVWTEEKVREFFEPYLTLHKFDKSHRHIIRGKAGKRRTFTAYFQKES